MYNPLIKNRYALVDLAKYGTRARKSIHSDVLIGDHPPYPIFREGDLLDANATFNLIQDSYDQGRVYKILSSQILQIQEHIDEVEGRISDSVTRQYVDEAINELAGVHAQDIQNINNEIVLTQLGVADCNILIQQIKDELDQFAISNRFVYDGLEENLIIIK